MLPSRRTALTAAVVVAIGFVLVRVLYRTVFGGVSAGSTVLIDLPRVPLSGPFEHVTLLGPISAEGLAAAALGAVPFALTVLVVGVAVGLLDVPALLVRGSVRGPVRSIVRALAIAVSTVPALVHAVRRVRIARELRGERGLAALLIPVLELTVERAIHLGAAMEARGFAATRHHEPVCEYPVRVRAASIARGGTRVLTGVTLDLAPGTLTLVTGPTGSGKSTFLDALSGVGGVGTGASRPLAGSIEVVGADRAVVPARETARSVGVVAQNVRSSFVAVTVAEEVGFALATRGLAPSLVTARVREVAERLDLTPLLDREVAALSAGQACLVAIAAALAQHPVVLLVDEPLTDLDDRARETVVEVLDRLAHEAMVCVVVAEHRADWWGGRPDAVLAIDEGVLHDVTHAARPAPTVPRIAPEGAESVTALSAVALEARGLSVSRGDRLVLDDLSLRLHDGEIIALHGVNGAGKSTLLDALARPRARGHVFGGDRDLAALDPAERRGHLALVPEVVDDLFFAPTVASECRRADRRARRHDPAVGGRPESTTARRFLDLLGEPADGAALLARHPRDLSMGQRRCLALALQLAARPRAILIDEPTGGLDAAARDLVARAVIHVAASSRAVIVATHDREFADRVATRTLELSDARLHDRAPSPRVVAHE